MKKLAGVLIVLGLVATPALAQRIVIDYDHDYDFSTVKTFQYVETEDSNAGDQLTDKRIKEAIIQQLSDDLKQVDSDPDIFVTYHLTTQDRTVYNTSSYGYGGYGGGWGRWGGGASMGSSTTTASTYTDGTVIVDAYESADKQMVWRGTGTVTVKAKPEKQAKQIQSIMTKMGKKWDKILQNQGK